MSPALETSRPPSGQGKGSGGSQKGRLITVTHEQKNQVLAMRGEKVAQIARTVGLSRPTVYRLLQLEELEEPKGALCTPARLASKVTPMTIRLVAPPPSAKILATARIENYPYFISC